MKIEVLSPLTESEEQALVARQKRNAAIWGVVLWVLVILIMVGTILGLVRLGVMPWDNSDLFRSA